MRYLSLCSGIEAASVTDFEFVDGAWRTKARGSGDGRDDGETEVSAR